MGEVEIQTSKTRDEQIECGENGYDAEPNKSTIKQMVSNAKDMDILKIRRGDINA